MQLFSKLIYNIFNNIEFGDKESYMSCLNVIIRKYSKECQTKLSELIAQSKEAVLNQSILKAYPSNESTFLEWKSEYTSKEHQPIIEFYCSFYQLQLWQQLRLQNYFNLANEFKFNCSPPLQAQINELELDAKGNGANNTINLSLYNILLIESICKYFNTLTNPTQLTQESIIIKQQAIERDLYTSILLIANLHHKYLNTKYYNEFLFRFVDQSNLSGNYFVDFPNYIDKMQLLCDCFQNTQDKITQNQEKQNKIGKILFSLKMLMEKHEKTKMIQVNKRNSYSPAQSGQIAFVGNPKILSHRDIRENLRNWGLPVDIIQKIVPSKIHDENSLINFDVEFLKEYGIALGVRKAISRNIKSIQLPPNQPSNLSVTHSTSSPTVTSPRGLGSSSYPILNRAPRVHSTASNVQINKTAARAALTTSHDSGTNKSTRIERSATSPKSPILAGSSPNIFQQNQALQQQQQSLNKQSITSMSNDQVCEFIKSIGFEMYIPLFKDNNISGKEISSYDVNSLKLLGVEKMGHRKAIIRSLQNL